MRIFGIFLAAMLAGCSSVDMVKYDPVAKPTQVTRYISGQPTLFSLGEYTVSVAPTNPISNGADRAQFFVMVLNNSDRYIDVGSENVTAFFQRESRTTPVRVLSYADLVTEIEKQEKSRRIANALGAAGASMSAGAAGANGDSTAAAIKKAEARSYAEDSKIAGIEAEKQKLGLLNNLLLTQTVLPGRYHAGTIILASENIDSDENGMFVLEVELAGERQRFAFMRTLLER